MNDYFSPPDTGRAAVIDALLAQSRGTDIPLLLKAKETAKKAVAEDPSNVNLVALQRVTKMLETAQMMNDSENVKTSTLLPPLHDVSDVLLYLKEKGRKIGKAKLYKDLNRGLLIRNKDLTFDRAAADKYGTSLPMAATPEHVARGVSDMQRRKDDAEVRIKEAEARRKELAADVAEGKFIARANVEQELAARAVTFNTGLKTAIEAQAQECIESVGGNPQLAHNFLRLMESIVDECSNRYAQAIDIEVSFDDLSDSVESDTE